MPINTAFLDQKVQDFIKAHEHDDITKLILKGSPFESIDIQSIAQQIKGRQVAREKFPKLYHRDKIIYPPKLNLEQSSSERTAKYKAEFLKSNDTLIDLTGGIGIDTLAFAEAASAVTYCELNPQTFAYAQHNFTILNHNISTHCGDGIAYLQHTKKTFDWIYIDPSRRNQQHKKVFRLEDCTPNILEHLELFKSKTKCLMLKTSPLLDLNLCIRQIKYISNIHIVALKNEVKELLLIINFETAERSPKIKAVNLETQQADFEADFDLLAIEQDLSEPQNYLYEPNPAIMKSGLFGELCRQYKVKAIAQQSHLFTSKKQIDFPGRGFKIDQCISPKKAKLKQVIPNFKANISCRNYPLKPYEIKKKYGLKDGGDLYIFFTTNHKNKKIVLICHKIRF